MARTQSWELTMALPYGGEEHEQKQANSTSHRAAEENIFTELSTEVISLPFYRALREVLPILQLLVNFQLTTTKGTLVPS